MTDVDFFVHKRSSEELAAEMWRLLGHYPESFAENVKESSEVIIFGSAACGTDGPNSDLDILAIGDGQRLKTDRIDLIFVSRDSTDRKSWLGGELAGHVAAYGVWVQGTKKPWVERVSASSWYTRKKKVRILETLSGGYARRDILARRHIEGCVQRAVLDMLRLAHMLQRCPVPSTESLKRGALEDNFRVVDELPRLIGKAPVVMLEEMLCPQIGHDVRRDIEAAFSKAWRTELRAGSAWRRAGRPVPFSQGMEIGL